MTSTILATEKVKTDSIQTHPENVRQGNLEEIKSSLTEHGQYRTIVVNKRNNYILAGNHTYLGAVDLGWDEVEVNWVDADDVQEKKILLVDNRTSDLSTYDNEKLAAMLEGMMLKGELQGTGWNADAVDDLMSSMDAVEEVAGGEFAGGYAESAEDTAARYKAPGEVQPMRQFVLLYPEKQAAEVETQLKTLQKAWGVPGNRDVVAEALKRCIDAET